jgi:hypothetical protein
MQQLGHLKAMLRLKEETITALEDEQEGHRQKVRDLTSYRAAKK